MAMIVDTTTYATPDGSYAVGHRVQFEPKTGLYEVNCYYMGKEAHRAYFDSRKPAVKYANDWTMRHWMKRIVPEQPKRTTAENIFSLDAEKPTDRLLVNLDRKGLIDWAAFTDSMPHLSHNPAQCRCGDCLTYLAGEG